LLVKKERHIFTREPVPRAGTTAIHAYRALARGTAGRLI
jgi:hypothetical protein